MKFIWLLIPLFLLSCSTLDKKSTDFTLRPYKKITLSNGLKVFLIEDKSLPTFSVNMLVYSGATADPSGRSGLAKVTATMLEKGTKKKSALQLADDFAQVGAEIGTSVSKDFITVEANSLSFHRDQILKDFVDVVTRPSFKAKEIKKVKRNTLSNLQKSVDNPSHFTEKVFQSYLYGSHPYGNNVSGKKTDVKKISRKDIVSFYRSHFTPNNAAMAVVGDFGPGIVQQLDNLFAHWKGSTPKPVVYPGFPKIEGVQIQLIDKPDLAQTQIRLGHEGIKRTNPDFLALRVANTILGRGFNSRLMAEIRVKRGLTYGVSSNFDARKETGPFAISTFSRHDKVGETVQTALDVLGEFRKSGVKAQEVSDAKEYLKGVFPRALETAERLGFNLLVLDFYQLTDSYLRNYLTDIDKISQADVNRVVRKYFHPDSMKVLVYSSKKQVLPQLQKIGVVKVRDYNEFL